MDILKVGLIGIGGYLLYEYLFGTAAAPVASTGVAPSSIAPAGTIAITTTSGPANTGGGGGPITSLSVSNLTANELINEAAGDPAVVNGLATAYVWGWYMNKLTGVTPPLNLGGNYTAMISAQTYLSALQSGGGLSGIGEILNTSKFPVPSRIGWGVGDEDFLAGLGAVLFAGHKPGSMTLRGLGVLEDDPDNSAAYIDQQPFLDAFAVNGGLDSTTTDFYLAAGLPTS